MKLEIDLCFKSNKWPKSVVVKEKELFSLLALEIMVAIKALNLCNIVNIDLFFVSDAEIKRFNSEFRGKNSATNVLSFPMEDFSKGNLSKCKAESLHLGDIIFSFETINRESAEQGKDFKNHLLHLFVHSMLHLLGYVHDLDEDREEMEKLEIAILKKFGIGNPYV